MSNSHTRHWPAAATITLMLNSSEYHHAAGTPACITQIQCLDPGLQYDSPDCIIRKSCDTPFTPPGADQRQRKRWQCHQAVLVQAPGPNQSTTQAATKGTQGTQGTQATQATTQTLTRADQEVRYMSRPLYASSADSERPLTLLDVASALILCFVVIAVLCFVWGENAARK